MRGARGEKGEGKRIVKTQMSGGGLVTTRALKPQERMLTFSQPLLDRKGPSGPEEEESTTIRRKRETDMDPVGGI